MGVSTTAQGAGQRRGPVQERSQETVGRVLAGAGRLLARGVSPQGLTTSQIAAEAGLSVGALYRFFPDKQAIVDAGGWDARTLTEDLDLSLRAWAGGARFVYLDNVEVMAELPAAVNACSRNGRSAVSQRAEDAASGRMTPTLATEGAGAAELLSGAAELLAGAAELDAASPPLPPHAARRRPAAARPAKAPNVRLDMCVLSQQGDPAGVG